MTRFATILVLSLAATVLTAAQTREIAGADFDTLRPRLTEGFVHVGGGQLVAVRSCYIIWIGVTFEHIEFNAQDSTLLIAGTVFDAAGRRSSISGVEIWLGRLHIDSANAQRASFTVQESRPIGAYPYFYQSFKIGRDDDLCFALTEEQPLDLDSLMNQGNIRRVIQTGRVKMYRVGKLL